MATRAFILIFTVAPMGALAACGGTEQASDSGIGTVTGKDGGRRDGSPSRDAGAPSPFPFDWVGVLGSGQSLSVGAEGLPARHQASAFGNLMLSDPRNADGGFGGFDGGTEGLSVVPLFEPERKTILGATPAAPAYPNNIQGVTPHLTMADQATTLALARTGQELVTVHSVIGISGQPLTNLVENGPFNSFDAAVFEATALSRLAAKANKSFGYGGMIFTHGESDNANEDYEAGLLAYWSSLNEALKAVTGQTSDVPMFLTQQSSVPWPADATKPEHAISTLVPWFLASKHPEKFILVGPKYQYSKSVLTIHLTAGGYRQLGIKYAQAFYQVVVENKPWIPLAPKGVTRDGTTITVAFHVPVPPLNWDSNIVPPHAAGSPHAAWAAGRGFEVSDSTGDLTIQSVAIEGDSVEILLAAEPTGSDLVVRYAMSPDRYGPSNGPLEGRRGQLRDSDPFVGTDRRTITALLQQGSTSVAAAPWTSFDDVSVRDLVEGEGLSTETVVLSRSVPTKGTLSEPWPGASGTVTLEYGGRAIETAVTQGSTEVSVKSFLGLLQMDINLPVTGPGAPEGLLLVAHEPVHSVTLSHPWMGPSGAYDLVFRSDQRNRAVHFELPVP
ncbi:MAG: hypothetical protein KC416_05695 [Myxococcales bacterium]|nr:hypothetical protein [Myxococcales bacterium]